eukprot:2331015-Amphidinium_carterae.1
METMLVATSPVPMQCACEDDVPDDHVPSARNQPESGLMATSMVMSRTVLLWRMNLDIVTFVWSQWSHGFQTQFGEGQSQHINLCDEGYQNCGCDHQSLWSRTSRRWTIAASALHASLSLCVGVGGSGS